MSTSFSYDVIIRHFFDDSTAESLGNRLRAKGLRVWSGTRQRGSKPDPDLDRALKSSRIMLLLLSGHLTDTYWFPLETDSFLFRDPADKDRRLITIRLKDTPLRPGLEKYPSFEWDWNNSQRSFEPILEACLPETTFNSLPAAPADDCPLQRLFSFGHSGEIVAAVFSADSQHLLTASLDHTLRLWEPASGLCLRIFQDGEVQYLSAAYNPNGHTVASGSSDSKIRVWDIGTGQVLYKLEDHTAPVNSLAWSPDGRYLLSGSADSTLRIWEATKCLRVLSGHTGPVMSVAWSPDGHSLLSGSLDKSICIWYATNGVCVRRIGKVEPVDRVAWSPDGLMFFARMASHSLEIWDTVTGQRIHQLRNAVGPLYNLTELAWSRDSRFLLIGMDSATEIHVWDVATGQSVKKLWSWPSGARSVAWSPDGRFGFLGGKDCSGQIWEMDNDKRPHPHRLQGHHGSLCRSVLSRNDRLLLTGGEDETVRAWDLATGSCRTSSDGGHRGAVCAIAWSPDNRAVLSGSADGNLRLRTLNFQERPILLKGTGALQQIDWEPDGLRVLSASAGRTLQLWRPPNPNSIRTFPGHRDTVTTVKWSPDGTQALSGSRDTTLRLWDVTTSESIAEWTGHRNEVNDVAWSPDGTQALSASSDRTIRVWETRTGRCTQILEGHTSLVLTVAWSPDSRFILSGSDDKTVRIWDAATGNCLYELKGHTERVVTVAWSSDHGSILATAANGVMRVWDVSALASKTRLPASHTDEQVRYANAKVLIVGDSGVGKTALTRWLAGEGFMATTSTDGAWVTHCSLPASDASAGSVTHEIWLWDFAGQQDYRLVNQLFMEEAAVAILLFDPQKEDLFFGLEQWISDLRKAIRKPFTLLLAAGRVDRGGLLVSRARINRFIQNNDIDPPLHETSALRGTGCENLRDAIITSIDWQNIPVTSSPALYLRLKQEILNLRDNNMTFIGLPELKERMDEALRGETFGLPELGAVIDLLAGPGIIRRLDFGDLILLKPEILSSYAAALIRKVRNQPDELGYIGERDLLEGNLDYQDIQRLPVYEEKLVLLALSEILVRNAWCLRQPADGKTLLVFPGLFRRERPEQERHPDTDYNFRFKGPVNDIYATLIVRLNHTRAFSADQLWKDAADFRTVTGQRLGLSLTRGPEGVSRLDVWFQPDIDPNTRLVFLRYIYDHLVAADAQIVSRSPVEEKFDSTEITELAGQLEEESQYAQDEQSKEGQLVGLTMYITHSAGQLYQPITSFDIGIDGQILFKDDEGNATAAKLYVQLKSGDSYLRQRKRDGAEVFRIKKANHVRLWREQKHPVMLIIRTSDGVIRWMDVRDYLRKLTDNGSTTVTQIIFDGEPFDIASIRRWREKFISPPLSK